MLYSIYVSISYSVLKVLVISCPLISAVRWRSWAEVNKQVNTKLLIMIGLETKLCIALLPPLTQLWQDNWIPTWKWFECFLQLLGSSLFDWAGLQTPPEERGGRLEQWGRVGDLVRHLYTQRCHARLLLLQTTETFVHPVFRLGFSFNIFYSSDVFIWLYLNIDELYYIFKAWIYQTAKM